MLSDSQLLFKIATVFYGLSLTCAFFSNRRRAVLLAFLLPGLFVNPVVVFWRFWTAWPMLPMYAGPLVVPLFMGTVVALDGAASLTLSTLRGILTLTVVIALAGVLFPKDYYIPFIKSQTICTHLFFWFGVAGRGCFLIAAAWAITALAGRNGVSERRRGADAEPGIKEKKGRRTTATWFFYICLLHLHLTGSWTARGRSLDTALG